MTVLGTFVETMTLIRYPTQLGMPCHVPRTVKVPAVMETLLTHLTVKMANYKHAGINFTLCLTDLTLHT